MVGRSRKEKNTSSSRKSGSRYRKDEVASKKEKRPMENFERKQKKKA